MSKVDWTSSNAYTQFKMWRKEVERIIGGPLAAKTDIVKINHIYIWAGAHAETLIEARKAENPDTEVSKPDKLLDAFAGCLTHSTQFREAREAFYNIKQQSGENTTMYYSRIIALYQQSEFPDGSDFLIVDKLIHGCTNSDSKRKLMAKPKAVTVKDCLDLREEEALTHTMQKLQGTSVNAAYSKDPTKRSQRNGSRKPQPQHQKPSYKPSSKPSKTCVYCNGDPHPRSKCPAQNSKCNYCGKQGHFEKACIGKKRQKSKKSVYVVEASDDSDYSYDMSSVSVSAVGTNSSVREVLTDVTFRVPFKSFKMIGKVDTGAMVSCIPLEKLPSIGLKKKDIQPSSDVLRGISGTSLESLLTISVNTTCNDITASSNFYVTIHGKELILGIGFCKSFNLVNISNTCIQRQIQVENAVHVTDESTVDFAQLQSKWSRYLPLGKKTGDPLEDLKLIFPTAFDGKVGLFKGEAVLKLSPDAKPVQLAPRAVPQSLLPELKKQLDEMEKEGIIRECPETTDWVHNLVLPVKKSGGLRICLDPRNLNKHLIRNVYYTASFEDAQHSFRNGKLFSTLDAKCGYWTKKLSPESQLITAFNTPFKKYCFVRMPFGLSVSSEIFQQEMDNSLTGIPGTFPCADDVKVQGSDELRHDINLLETVYRATKAGLKFNPAKCNIKKPRVSYFGRVITPSGVEPCPDKVKAVLQMQSPQNKQELLSLFGSINFLSTHIPNLSKKTQLMRSLLKSDTHYVWTSDMQKEFDTLKSAVKNHMDNVHFDPSKKIYIETDATQKGLGIVMHQDGKPVKFLSHSLTPAESNYSNIERELLAVLVAREKLHSYIFGQKVTIHTDHKPLESIFQKPISLAPPRLQRMLLRMTQYDLDVKYVGAKKVLLADTLSQLSHMAPRSQDLIYT
ncbi:uncharacterized protein LOC134763680 [Penaeus indicus]|uniref:uncharacterized protein LOC134763680 n=1 Tax=Penaeus indicus TaxID=29960 RepID=UPI00300C01B7